MPELTFYRPSRIQGWLKILACLDLYSALPDEQTIPCPQADFPLPGIPYTP